MQFISVGDDRPADNASAAAADLCRNMVGKVSPSPPKVPTRSKDRREIPEHVRVIASERFSTADLVAGRATGSPSWQRVVVDDLLARKALRQAGFVRDQGRGRTERADGTSR
jgi:hypothetical protein